MDQQQFNKLFTIYYSQLTVFVYRMIDNEELAKDIAINSLSKLYESTINLKNEIEIKFFLFISARNAALNHLRKTKQAPKYTPMDFDMDEPDKKVIVNEEFKQKLYNQIELLSPQLKEVVSLSIQNLSIVEIAEKMCISNNAVFMLKKRAINSLRELFNNSNEASNNIPGHVSIINDEINAELIRHFAKHPHKIHDIDATKFEKLVAELMKDMGYDVYHTSQTKDGGRDIIAVLKTPSNDPIITIVECKRHRADRPVGIDIVRSFLFTIREQDKANAGWIVTTSTFSTEAINEQKKYKWQLSLKDNRNLAAWCSNYGQWKRPGGSGGLWLPNDPLA
jgi:RNA polymerase sigma factor (sigma-70 family)